MELRRDCEEQSPDSPEADAFLHDNKHISRCADSRQLKGGDPKMPSPPLPPPPTVFNARFTCRSLRAAPPPLARVRSHGELDPQRLAAAGRMVDGGVHNLVNGVEQAGDILRDMVGVGVEGVVEVS